MESQTYQIGATIFKEGDVGNMAYLVKSGSVKITKLSRDDTPRTIATVGPGNIIGEMALIDDEPRAATAITLDQTEVLLITKDEFQKRLQTSDQVISLLLQTFTNRLRQQAQQIIDMTI